MYESYRKLMVWKKSIILAKEIYQISSLFPDNEKFGLIPQIRRSAISIASNIAEGHGRFGSAEYKHFIAIARGSLNELETQLILSCELKFIDEKEILNIFDLIKEIGKMLNGLIKHLMK